jgi:hypothetical protein
MSLTMLVLNIQPALEDDLVDYLLQCDGVGVFTSYRIQGHGGQGKMNLAEQVAGRRHRLRFEIVMQEIFVEPLLAGLAAEVGRGIVYWQQPVKGFGSVT